VFLIREIIMNYTCLKCSQGFNANFTPNKSRPCKFCNHPCIPEGKRLDAKIMAVKVMKHYISLYGEVGVWQLIEKSVAHPLTRIYFRNLLATSLKNKKKKKN